jgi:glycyl-tRNA synthetase alpha subunit
MPMNHAYRYNNAVSYGELFLQNEYEMSVYNLEKADVAGQRQRWVFVPGFMPREYSVLVQSCALCLFVCR